MASDYPTAICGQDVIWERSPEDDGLDRYETDLVFPLTVLNVNVIVMTDSAVETNLTFVAGLIENLNGHFDANIAYLKDWYQERYTRSTPDEFVSQLLDSVTLFVDFDERPTKIELIFWKTELQHLGVPLTPDGKIVPDNSDPELCK